MESLKWSSGEINVSILCLYYLNFPCFPPNSDLEFDFSNTLLDVFVTKIDIYLQI